MGDNYRSGREEYVTELARRNNWMLGTGGQLYEQLDRLENEFIRRKKSKTVYDSAGTPFMNKGFFETYDFVNKTKKETQFLSPSLMKQGRGIDHEFVDKAFKDSAQGVKFYRIKEHLNYGN